MKTWKVAAKISLVGVSAVSAILLLWILFSPFGLIPLRLPTDDPPADWAIKVGGDMNYDVEIWQFDADDVVPNMGKQDAFYDSEWEWNGAPYCPTSMRIKVSSWSDASVWVEVYRSGELVLREVSTSGVLDARYEC